MKTIFLFLIAFCVFSTSYAQRYSKPFIDCNAGIGLFPTFLKSNATSEKLPIQLSADYRLSKNFSLGLSFGQSVTTSSKYIRAYQNQVAWKTNFKTAGLRLTAHTNPVGNWHFYGGTYLGLGMPKIQILEGDAEKVKTALGFKESNNQLHITSFIGSRCSIKKRLGFYGEIGFGISLVNIGLSYRI